MPREDDTLPANNSGSAATTLSSSVIETTAGFTAGVVTTLVVHPFDVLKTRLQLQRNESQWGNSLRILQDIVRNEGNYAALYRGLTVNLLGNSISWALYFLWYGKAKEMIQSYRGPGERLRSSDYFLASGGSGVLTAICTNPIWVMKTRMLSSGRNAPGAYRSTRHGIKAIWRTEGLRGFWHGMIPSLFGISHGAIQFAAYEQLKNWRRGRRERSGRDPELSNVDYLFLSGGSKMFAGSITYPYQVLRVRLQSYRAEQSYAGVMDAVKQIWRHEGVRGFYKGLGPNLLRVLPSTCTTFLVYENTKYYLPRVFQGKAGSQPDQP